MLIPDGYVPGLLVHPTCWDSKHPAEEPFNADEGIVLKNPRPDRDDDSPGKVIDTAGTAQGGGADYIDLATTASDLWGAYVNATITLTGGTGSGQVRTGQGYDGFTRRLVVAPWATPPDGTTTYSVDVGVFAVQMGFSTYHGSVG